LPVQDCVLNCPQAGNYCISRPTGAARSRSQKARSHHSSSLSTARKASVGICTVPNWRIFFLPVQDCVLNSPQAGNYCISRPTGAARSRSQKARSHHSSSLSTARKASVGICTVPNWRIFFLPVQDCVLNCPQAGNYCISRPTGAARSRSQKARSHHSSSLSTARKASVGICTVPNWRIFFLPSFCFSSSFFLRVMSPP